MKFLVSVFILVFSFQAVFPHSCAAWNEWDYKEYSRQLGAFDVIFYGEIISAVESGENQTQIVKFKVLRAWKGVESNEVTVRYGNPCGYGSPPNTGGRGVVLGTKSPGKDLIDVDCCNFGSFDEKRITIEYGEGRDFEKPPARTAPPEGFWSRLWNALKSIFS